MRSALAPDSWPGRLILAAAAVLVVTPSSSAQPTPTQMAQADALWEARAEGARDARPAPAPIRRAIEAYEALLEAEPESLEARWKLLRALYFQGEYLLAEREAKLAVFERARNLAEEGRRQLHQQVGLEVDVDDPDTVAGAAAGAAHAVEIYYYAAVHWGLWGQTTGKMKAARQGVGGKVRDYAEIVKRLDERFESAAGLRFLGRLHTEAPKIPFITGWIDRDRAVGDLERACQLAPEHPDNQRFLADALLRFAPERRAEGIERLEALVTTEPRPGYLVEDSASLAAARALLAERRD